MPLATVIIPCGPRHTHLLARAVRSVYRQTVPTDVLTYIDHAGRGPAYGRNLLARQVTTPFLIMLDADDMLEPTFVEETYAAWRPGSYVYTDWYQGVRHMKAHWCYPFSPREGEANFMLPPALIPTRYWALLGGMDEELFGAEDTDFFWKANAMLLARHVVRKPLMVYTGDGYRSKEAARNPQWHDLLDTLRARWMGAVSMACCGKPAEVGTYSNERTEGDLLVRPTFKASKLYVGRVTLRKYGRISASKAVYMHPADYQADKRLFTIQVDWVAASPTAAEIAEAAKTPVEGALDYQPKADPAMVAAVTAVLKRDLSRDTLIDAIVKLGVRTWGANDAERPYGFDMQQHPEELADLLLAIHEAAAGDVPRVFEVGTGSSAGTARFMTEVLGWHVTSIDIREPNYAPRGAWQFILEDAAALDPNTVAESNFTAILIDGDHRAEATQAAWDLLKPLAPLVALHDIAENAIAGSGPGDVWQSAAYTKAGNLRKHYHAAIAPDSRLGWGWYLSPRASEGE